MLRYGACLFGFLVTIGLSPCATAADVKVMISAGFFSVYKELAPAFESATGHRLVTTRGLEETDAMNMIASQMPAELKSARADYVIENTGSLEDLERDVDALWSSLQRNAEPLETAAQVS